MLSIDVFRAGASAACAAALVVLGAGPRALAMPAGHAPGRRGKPDKAEKAEKIKPRKKDAPAEASSDRPVCLVEITTSEGAPLQRMQLIAFEDGVYRVRSKNGNELSLAESDVSSVRFLPLHDKKPGRPETAGRHEDAAAKARGRGEEARDRLEEGSPRRPLAEGRPIAEALRRGAEVKRLFEYREVLREARRQGRFAEHVAGLKEGLRDCASVKEAAGLVWALGVAHHDEHGRLPTQEEWRALAASVRDETVRAGLRAAAPELIRRLSQAVNRPRQPPFRRGIGRNRPAP